MNINFLIFLFLLINYSVFSQTITGKVIDEYGLPIQDAHVVNNKIDDHTHTNEKGVFTLDNCSVGDSLQISFVGYKSKLIEIESLKQPIVIVMYDNIISLEEITISPKINSLHVISDVDIQNNPVKSSQDILQKVPGLFIGQHAGGGKAEQIFLRGFDIDHGTDINITVDGLPVNMVSHAHGQGFADLHFVIPETVDKIDFGKGPYYENKGNFTTAGYVDFRTKQKLKNSSVKLEIGDFNSYRLLGMFNLLNNNKHNTYIATEFISTDGYFDSPQNFNRVNLFGKYSGKLTNTDHLGVTASYFNSKWDASGQIPQRAVDKGIVSRFGAIDDTEGGATSRKNLLAIYTKKINENATVKNRVYINQYDFELYSNFTFFLEDPINGDQIKQKENRIIYGLSTEYDNSFSTEKIKGNWIAGFSLRNDQSKDNELSHTLNRTETLERLQLGNINETNIGGYLGATIDIKKWTFNPSIRLDYFDFQYNDKLTPTYKTQEKSEVIVSPKFNILFNPTNNFQIYLKTGKGFHSNDTRVVLADKSKTTLPAAYGYDLGYIWKPTPKMLLNMTYWSLYLEQEFVYVGDAGIVEPSGKTSRQGIDLSYRYQPLTWLNWRFDANYTHARAISEPNGKDYIPLAPDFTLASGLDLQFKSGLYANINVRHLANRPANEDYSIVAKGYTIANLNTGYKWRDLNFGIQIQNLFNTKWNETQFATESRLQNETDAVEEIHFTPGTPFFIKGMIQYNF